MSDVPVLTVSELTQHVKDLLETSFPVVLVVGEISNYTRAASGHLYFTLKDEYSQIRAVMWRGAASRVKFELHDGLQVIAAGPLEVYQARGTYQIVVEDLVPQGIGALELAFRQLQERLRAEGLFDPERKRPLPRFPRRIALVTSPTGAAVRDLLQVITRRWQAAEVVIVPVPVQGDGAAEKIAFALGMVHRIPRVDVVVVGRGGGSLEDLWAFNEEVVARAIAKCRVPVVSAVGHEIDVTIADLVADRRALTPSEAGELVVPHRDDVLAELRHVQDRIVTATTDLVERGRMLVDGVAARRAFARPFQMLHDRAARLDELSAALGRSARRRADRERIRLAGLAAQLDALSPLKVLGRGYSVTSRAEAGEVLRDAAAVREGDSIVTRLSSGRILSRVEVVVPEARAGGLTAPLADPIP